MCDVYTGHVPRQPHVTRQPPDIIVISNLITYLNTGAWAMTVLINKIIFYEHTKGGRYKLVGISL